MEYNFSRYNIVSEKKGIPYIVNTLSGALIKLDVPTYSILKEKNIKALTDTQKEILIKQGMLIDSEIDELKLLRAAYKAYNRGRKSVTVIVCPTMECNFACPYCFEEHPQGHMNKKIENGVVAYVEKLLKDGYELLNFEWFGGEPLLYPDIIERVSLKIMDLCKNYSVKCEFAITTNGYCINDKVLSIFKNIHMGEVRITLDGGKELHDKRRTLVNGSGTFDVIARNIRRISELGIKVKVRVNIDKQNPDAFAHVKDALTGIENLRIYPAKVSIEPTQDDTQKARCYAMGETNEFHQAMYHKYGFKPIYEKLFQQGVCSCMAEHDASCVIDHNGNVYKCVNDVGRSEWAISNILDTTGKKNPKVVSIYLGRDPFSETPCTECQMLPLCYGGCVNVLMRQKKHDCVRTRYIWEDIVEEKLGL